MQTQINSPLTNVQLELLQIFAHELTDEDLLALRKTLASFFAQRLIQAADKTWDEKEWTAADMERMLNTKMRKRP
jgi:hypothetical protein